MFFSLSFNKDRISFFMHISVSHMMVEPGNVFSQRWRACLYWITKGVTEGYQTELTESWLLHPGA